MDSTFASDQLAATAPDESLGARWLTKLHGWRAGPTQVGREAARQRRRLMALDWRRLCLWLIVASVLSAGAAIANFWYAQHTAVRASVAAALSRIEQRLDDIDQEMRFLAAPGAGHDCSEAHVGSLLRASLNSTAARRFTQGVSGQDFSCGPEGRAPALAPIADSPWTGLLLGSTGQISSRLVLSKTDESGLVTRAELGPRVFSSLATGSAADVVPHVVVVLTATGQRLAELPEPAGEALLRARSRGEAPALHAVALSSRHGLAVGVEVSTETLLAHGARRVAWVLAVVWLLVAGVAGAVWQRAVARARLRHRIAQGLRRRQFEPHVQPVVDLLTGRCVGAEVLMRWYHPNRGVLAPSEFIDEAERTGLIVAMSDLVMAAAAQRLAQLAQLRPELYFSFNITPAQLREPGFAQRLDELFNDDSLPRTQVLLELTEREFVDPRASRALESLKRSGWRIAIDDFGTGQSSLAFLEQLSVDRIKIDRAFVRTIDEHTVKRPVLDAIIALASQLQVQLIAEGVETASQWDYLRQRGVQSAQGYLFARPMPIDAFARWLWQNHGLSTRAAAVAEPANPAQEVSVVQVTAPHHPACVDSPNALLVDAQAQQLWQRLRTAGGLDVRTRLYGLRSYADCFVGRQAVDWLVRHQRIERGQAVRLGQRLMALGLVRHVLNEHDFKDDELFYCLAAAPATEPLASALADGLLRAVRGPSGPGWRDRTVGLLRHRDCASGREVIDWIASSQAVSRELAWQWGTQLMREGALRHVFDDQPLQDNHQLYRLG